jgi:pilus assembly protein Flp/PilA
VSSAHNQNASEHIQPTGAQGRVALLVRFPKTEDSPPAVEFAVMLALIIVVCLVAITTLGNPANNTFRTNGAKVQAAAS